MSDIIRDSKVTLDVSIVIPVYNVENYIGRCIESIQKQSLKNWELILVDDCGSDNSMSVVKKYAAKDKRIIYLESKSNVGPMVARDRGSKISKGSYVTYVDGDDTIPEDALETLYNEAVSSNADIVVGEALRINEDGSTKPFMSQRSNGLIRKRDVFEKLVTRSFPHNVCGKLFRGDLVRNKKVRAYEGLTNGEDGYYFVQILRLADKIKLIDKVVYEYWTYSSSSSHKKMTEQMMQSMAIYESFLHTILVEELGNIDEEYNKTLCRTLYNISKVYPYERAKSILENNGIYVNTNIRRLIKDFPLLKAMKYSLMYHIYSKLFA